MFRRIEHNGKAVWYLEPQFVYILLACIAVVLLIMELLPEREEKIGNHTLTVYSSLYENRIISLIRRSEKRNVSSANNSMKQCRPSPEYVNKYGDDMRNLVKRVDSFEGLLRLHADMVHGAWKPRDCVARHRVAIVIPYRDRESHLISLLVSLVPLLKAQQLHFRIYLSEQVGNLTFNKGVLMNGAFLEALRDQHWDCFVFHDVDLLPENIRIQYSCPKKPRHLSAAIDEFYYILPYDWLVGGVLVLRTEHFIKVNGYSNLFWGWGGEDDDMERRIKVSRLRVERLAFNIARYHQIEHQKRKPASWKIRYRYLRTKSGHIFKDGVNSVKYKLVNRAEGRVFTHFFIDVGTPPD